MTNNSFYKADPVKNVLIPLSADTTSLVADTTAFTENLTTGTNIKGYAAFAMMYDGIASDGNLKIAGNTDTDQEFKVECSKVYPEYLAYLDAKEFIDNDEKGPKNLHRCEWAKKCGVPWSSAGC